MIKLINYPLFFPLVISTMTKKGQNDVGNVTSLVMFFLNTGGRRFTEASNE